MSVLAYIILFFQLFSGFDLQVTLIFSSFYFSECISSDLFFNKVKIITGIIILKNCIISFLELMKFKNR